MFLLEPVEPLIWDTTSVSWDQKQLIVAFTPALIIQESTGENTDVSVKPGASSQFLLGIDAGLW